MIKTFEQIVLPVSCNRELCLSKTVLPDSSPYRHTLACPQNHVFFLSHLLRRNHYRHLRQYHHRGSQPHQCECWQPRVYQVQGVPLTNGIPQLSQPSSPNPTTSCHSSTTTDGPQDLSDKWPCTITWRLLRLCNHASAARRSVDPFRAWSTCLSH